MRPFALFALACIVGTAIATTGGSDEVLKCAEPKDSYITLRFLRHGLSCAQCCRDIAAKLRITNPKFLPCLQFLFDNKDPMLTDKGLQLLVNTAPKLQTCAPDQSWTVMSSPMTRTVETALALFPKFNVTVVPYMKECIAAPLLGRCTRPYSPDIAPEDQLCPNVDAQQRKLGPLKKNVIYDRETVKPGAMRTVDWAEAAHTTDPALFFKYLARYAKANNKRKFVVVTHNGVMIKLLMKFGVTPSLLQNAEMWEGKLTLSGDPVPKLKAVQVFKTPGTTASCSDMTTPQFNTATARCNVK